MPAHKTSGSSFKILYERLSKQWMLGAFLKVGTLSQHLGIH